MTIIAERAVAVWATARQTAGRDSVLAGLTAIARRTTDPTHPRQYHDLHQALNQLAAEQDRNGRDHCHSVAATLTVAALLARHPGSEWLAAVFYRAAASYTDPVSADQHLWDTLDMVTIYDALTDYRRAFHTARDLARSLIAGRAYLDPVTIAACLTWAHLHLGPYRLLITDGIQTLAACGLRCLPQPMPRAALTGLARLLAIPTGTRTRLTRDYRLACLPNGHPYAHTTRTPVVMPSPTNPLNRCWTAVRPCIHRAAGHFRSTLADRLRPSLPERDTPLFLATLGQLVAGDDNHAGRTALLAAFAPTYRHLRLQPCHHPLLVDALTATIARYAPAHWTPQTARLWQRGGHHALNLTHRAADRVRTARAWTPAVIIGREKAADTITILTLAPRRQLRYSAGQAIPVTTPRRPGLWRWYSPANAPRPDGTIELHVRAIPDGPVSALLAHHVTVGEQVWLGQPYHTGLSLHPAHSGDLLLIAGGTGLAPLRAICEHLAADAVPRRVTLVVGARTMPDLYDSIALDKLQTAHGDWLTVVPALSEEPCVEAAAQGDVLTLAVERYQPGQHVYVAGPPGLITQARLRLPASGIPADRLHLAETFARQTSDDQA